MTDQDKYYIEKYTVESDGFPIRIEIKSPEYYRNFFNEYFYRYLPGEEFELSDTGLVATIKYPFVLRKDSYIIPPIKEYCHIYINSFYLEDVKNAEFQAPITFDEKCLFHNCDKLTFTKGLSLHGYNNDTDDNCLLFSEVNELELSGDIEDPEFVDADPKCIINGDLDLRYVSKFTNNSTLLIEGNLILRGDSKDDAKAIANIKGYTKRAFHTHKIEIINNGFISIKGDLIIKDCNSNIFDVDGINYSGSPKISNSYMSF